MNSETREKLSTISVATLATALYKRGLRNQVIQGVRPLGYKGKNMVGPAFTLRYMPAREDRNQLVEFRNPAHPQRVAIETCPPAMCWSWIAARMQVLPLPAIFSSPV